MLLNGIFAPICTPFTGGGEVNYGALRENLAKYHATGVRGYAVAGSTGEAAFLSRDEKLKLFEAVRAAADGKTLIAGTGVESVRETVRLIADAAAIGYGAALVLTPHYYRGQMARPESQTAFFRAVADESPVPVLIYDFPQMTGIDLPVELVVELAAHPNIAGIKESSADLEKIGKLIASVPPGFQVLVGSSAKFHASLKLGAIGGILAIANAVPHAAQSIYTRFVEGDVTGSSEAQQRIVEAANVAPRYGIQGLKYAMDLKGYFGGPARLPLVPVGPREKAEIEELFRAIEG